MGIHIRKATIDDMSYIYQLVRELAVYEKEPDAVRTTIKDFESAFEDDIFDVLVAVADNRIVGMAIYYMTFSTWRGRCIYLEDFYVQPSMRRNGIGQSLFDAFIRECKAKNASSAKWQILNWNEPALAFYRKNKATLETNWWNGKLYF
ncbi:MAG TPA: GNAT family N-acetyltransferase [Saprospiraceae bacterium]|nr:GNAT family N-acetyltransferase [Saprospiraceae bacterium]HRO09476.1 GNAT family N-acetyltransferase [Saprospiraceae bacterium]HRP42754.1 GNAT family N-acetyltransferase [Saprospiraceae bacterium]